MVFMVTKMNENHHLQEYFLFLTFYVLSRVQLFCKELVAKALLVPRTCIVF